MDRKAPPQAVAEDNSKLPAVSTRSPKRTKINGGKDGPPSEVIDVALEMNFQRGDCIEVKWTINDDDDSEGEGQHNSEEVKMMAINEDESPKQITVWWAATLCEKTDKMHTLTDEESKEREGAYELHKSPGVQVPIYTLNYAPLEEHGFDTHSLEDVAFISNRTLLNLSTDEMMTFRKSGEPSPPSSPTPDDTGGKMNTSESVISREFASQDEMGDFINQLMQQCLTSTGMAEKMTSLPASEQLIIAERIKKAKEGFLSKIIEETDKMGAGNKVITGEVVKRCMAQMKGAY